jgi:hypothetical protein
MNHTRPRPKGVPEDFEPKPRVCPCEGFDIAIGDTVYWIDHKDLGALSIGSMHYCVDGKPAASVWTAKNEQRIAKIEELRVMDDAQWWGGES